MLAKHRQTFACLNQCNADGIFRKLHTPLTLVNCGEFSEMACQKSLRRGSLTLLRFFNIIVIVGLSFSALLTWKFASRQALTEETPYLRLEETGLKPKESVDVIRHHEKELQMDKKPENALSEKERQAPFNKASQENKPHEKDMTKSNVNNAQPKIVLLLGYYRSGSSFTGELLRLYNGSFYRYEPLHSLDIFVKGNRSTTFYNGTKRAPFDISDRYKLSMDLIRSIMGCDFLHLPKEFMVHGFASRTSQIWDYRKCVQKKMKPEVKCAKDFQQSCVHASMRILKVIRVRMASVENFVKLFPNLRVVHLIRDPRGLFLSQRKLTPGPSRTIISNICADLQDDLAIRNRLERNYPGQFMELIYEDLAQHPVKTASKLYSFLGLNLPAYVSEWIFNSTIAPKDNGLMGTTRVNSTETAYSWTKKIKWDDLTLIQQNCSDIIKWANFPYITSTSQLENFTIPRR